MKLTNSTPTPTITLYPYHHAIPDCLVGGRQSKSKQSPLFLFSSRQHHHPKPISSSSKTPTNDTFDFQPQFDDEEDEEEEEEDVYVPLGKMRQWTQNKPRGFGEGKVYDTTLEEKLLEELQQHTRAAQLTNPTSQKEKEKEKEKKAQGEGDVVVVRLLNLPKKKNIHRDLHAAFKPLSFSAAITNIVPAVSGNHKTRDPVCKGYAFLHFNSLYHANRFVDTITTQPITFGKLQKQIRCEIVKPSSPSVDRGGESPLPLPNAAMAPVTETPVVPCAEDAGDVGLISATDDVEDADLISATGDHNNNSYDVDDEAQVELKKPGVVVREKGKKKKVENAPKLNIPGSANRLKTKEKALLSGVFSKYGGKAVAG